MSTAYFEMLSARLEQYTRRVEHHVIWIGSKRKDGYPCTLSFKGTRNRANCWMYLMSHRITSMPSGTFLTRVPGCQEKLCISAACWKLIHARSPLALEQRCRKKRKHRADGNNTARKRPKCDELTMEELNQIITLPSLAVAKANS